MTVNLGVLFVNADSPTAFVNEDASIASWAWFNPDTGELKGFNTSSGQFDIDIPVKPHEHTTHGDINFTGDVSAGGDEGITGEYEGTFKKIIIKKGIITEFELE